MFVCVCNAITERAVDYALDQGPCRVSEVYSRLGCRAQCGKCVPTVRAMMQQHHAAMDRAIDRSGPLPAFA